MTPSGSDATARALAEFERLADLAPALREAALRDLVAADPSVGALVAAMLAEDGADTASGPRDEGLRDGEIRGQYRIGPRLGAGATSVVHAAEDLALGRRVALKLLRADVASPGAARRLRRETSLLARVEHPGCARLFEFGELPLDDGPRPYIAMELVDGEPVDAYVRRRGGGPRTAVGPLLDALDAVAFAHACGVVHRDLKPGNILVDRAGRAKVVDFGIGAALRATDASAGTATLAPAIGTPPYCAPEQVDGAEGRADPRTDVYAAGMTLYALVAGRPPFGVDEGGLFECLRRVKEYDPPPLHRAAPGCDRDLSAVVAKAVEKAPERRYATLRAFADDLRRWYDHRPVSARAAGPFERWRRLLRDRPRLAAARAAAVATVLVCAAAATYAVARGIDADRTAAAVRGGASTALEDLMRRVVATEIVGLRADVRRDLLREILVGVAALRAAEGYPVSPRATKLEADACRRLGDAQQACGDREGALDAVARATALYDDLLRLDPTDRACRRSRALCEVRLGDLDGEAARLVAAHRRYEAAHAVFAAQVAEDPSDLRALDELSWSCERLGEGARVRGNWRLAETRFEERFAIARRLAALRPDAADVRRGLYCALVMSAALRRDLGEEERARELEAEAAPLAAALGEERPADLAARVAADVARCATTGGVVELERLVREAEAFYGDDPTSAHAALVVCDRTSRLAAAVERDGDAPRAARLRARYAEVLDAAVARYPDRLDFRLMRPTADDDDRRRVVASDEDAFRVRACHAALAASGAAGWRELAAAAARFEGAGAPLWLALLDAPDAPADVVADAARRLLDALPERPTPLRARVAARLAAVGADVR